MDPQARPPRSALLAAPRNDGTTEELRGIGYGVDLQGNWLADSLIFTTDRLEGNLDNLPLGPRQILERHAAAYMSNAPARPSYVPARSISRPPSLNRPSAASHWGRPYPDLHLLPRPGTDAWYEYKFGRTARPTRTPAPAPAAAPLTTMPFADSSVISSPGVYQDNEENDAEDDAEGECEADYDWSHLSSGSPQAATAPTPAPTAAGSGAHLPASLIMSPESTAPSSFVPVGEEYRDDKKDDKKDDNKDDRDDIDDEDADAEVEYEDDKCTHLPLIAPNPGVPAAAAPTAIRLTSNRFPAGFQLWITTYRKRNKRFLVGPNYTGGPIQLPPKTFEFQYTLDDDPKRQEGCRWCGCSNWLWDPYFFMRTTNPDGRQDTCNRCVFRSGTKEATRHQELNAWLVNNQPVMFWLTNSDL
ncbi:hypothetical protein COL940_013441 [Colletotrichum noveboracense]|nr:hypothetical protein COL940_013441 [Colletotrichum noveboracense]KAJ0272064.1 hypothetical protein CBS470a_012859 [Colletotrichum nupharicola]